MISIHSKKEKYIYLLSGLLVAHTVTSLIGSLQISKAIATLFLMIAVISLLIKVKKMMCAIALVFVYSLLVLLSDVINYHAFYDFYISLIESLWWPSVFIIFYTLLYNEKARRTLHLTMVCLLVINIIFVGYYALNRYMQMGEIISFNQIYYVLCLVPFVSFIKSPVMKMTLLLLISMLVVISAKRTALIVNVLQLLVFVPFMIKGTKNRFFVVLLLAIVSYFAYIGLERIKNVTGYWALSRFETIQDDGGSGRTLIWMQVLNKYSNFSFPDIVFGRGHNAVRKDGFVQGMFSGEEHISAHNDFLEILYDFGAVTLVVYLLIIISMVKLAIFLRKSGPPEAYLLILQTITTTIAISITSHLVLYPTYYAYLIIAWVVSLYYKRLVSTIIIKYKTNL